MGQLFSRSGACLAVRLYLKPSPCANLSEVAKNVRENTKRLKVSPGLRLILSAATFIFFGTNINTANPAEGKEKWHTVTPHAILVNRRVTTVFLKDEQTLTSV